MRARYASPYSSDAAFLGAAATALEGAPGKAPRFAVAGVPFDGAVTNRPGARFGPAAIRAASRMLCDAIHPLFGCSPQEALVDFGDLALPVTSLAQQRDALQTAAVQLLGAHHVCWLGGDHSITLPILRAHRTRAGGPLAVVHLDAHCDTWSDHFGEPSGHGTWMREAIQERLVIPEATVQIGIRSPAAVETREFVQRAGGRVISARELRGRESAEQLASVIDEVRARVDRIDRPPVYLTLDIDCLDPAFAPGTGTPEAGGLTTAQVLSLLEALPDLNWVGMDCVEVAPPYDHADITSLAAATFVWTYLCGRLAVASIAGCGS
jgi:agmatinase